MAHGCSCAHAQNSNCKRAPSTVLLELRFTLIFSLEPRKGAKIKTQNHGHGIHSIDYDGRVLGKDESLKLWPVSLKISNEVGAGKKTPFSPPHSVC